MISNLISFDFTTVYSYFNVQMCSYFIAGNKIFCFFKKWIFSFLDEGVFQGSSQVIEIFFGGVKQYWHFHRVPYKPNYSKKFFRVHMTLISESYCQTILTYSELLSSSIHTFKELLPISNKYFFESFNGHLKRQIILKEKIPK